MNGWKNAEIVKSDKAIYHQSVIKLVLFLQWNILIFDISALNYLYTVWQKEMATGIRESM